MTLNPKSLAEAKVPPQSVIELDCLPNTGHCFIFVPLYDVEGRKLQEALPDLLKRDELVQLSRTTGWITNCSKPWLKLRIMRRLAPIANADSRDVVGLAVAVETNLGGRDRGYEYVRRSVKGAERTTLLTRSGAPDPYAATSVPELERPTDINLVGELPPLHDLIGDCEGLILRINWLPPGGSPIEVDVIVDFGNTRT